MAQLSGNFKCITALCAGGALLAGLAVVFWPAPEGALRQRLLGKAATRPDWAAMVLPYAGAPSRGDADGAVADARFADPFGIAQDRAGNLYIADAGDNNRLRKITPAGMVSTLAGGSEGHADGQGKSAAFHTPSGLALDAAGNLYVADTGNHMIRKVTPEGLVTTVAGDGRAGQRDGAASQAQFNGPIGVAVDAAGAIYVADTYNDRIRVISPQGQVSTLAGGARTGFADGAAADALFDTPSGLTFDKEGRLLVADTRNSAVRRIARDGMVSTLARGDSADREALLRRPVALAATHDGFVYVADMGRGRLLQIAPDGAIVALAGAAPESVPLRFARPTGLAIEAQGSLLVADASAHVIRKVVPHNAAVDAAPSVILPAPQAATTLPWPTAPQQGWHEVVGTMGEVRGDYQGEARHHFHSGLDVQAAIGTPVLAVADEKVSSPLSGWGYGELSEGLSIDTMTYIHMRVGRDGSDVVLDPQRFAVVLDEAGKPDYMRIRRGTRFKAGEAIGSVNRMYHVHLNHSVAGVLSNPQAFAFAGFSDRIAPRIEGIYLVNAAGQKLSAKNQGRLLVAAGGGDLQIVVDAWDQVDGNAARRRLGLYLLGYQLLHADGSAVPGYEQPRMNLEFNRLPPERELVKIAYADGSGITVHGNATTRFLYVVSNLVRDGRAEVQGWRVAGLTPGDYVLRIHAADHAGNVTAGGRDLPIRVN